MFTSSQSVITNPTVGFTIGWLLLVDILMSVVGLLAIWGGLGRGNWFLRAVPVLACISLLLAIPAFEPVVVYLVQAGLTIVALVAWRKWRLSRRAAGAEGLNAQANRPSPWQFSIRDLMLLTVLTAWVSAMLAEAPEKCCPSRLGGLVAVAETPCGRRYCGRSDDRRGVDRPEQQSLVGETACVLDPVPVGADGGVAGIVALGLRGPHNFRLARLADCGLSPGVRGGNPRDPGTGCRRVLAADSSLAHPRNSRAKPERLRRIGTSGQADQCGQ